MEDGIHDISNEEYHAAAAISRSGLKKLEQSPYHFWYEYLNPDKEPFVETPQMQLGSMMHALALEPDEFKKRFMVSIKVDRRTKQGKADWAAFLEEAGDKTLVTEEQYCEVTRMCNRLNKTDLVPSLIERSQIEKSIFFTHEETGLQCKVRPDMWFDDVVADLKTTADASYYKFQRSCVNFGYFLQAAMIKEALKSLGIEMRTFVNVCIETKPPYATGVYIFGEEPLTYGVNQFHRLMKLYKECKDANEWPGYEVATMDLPNYVEE